jgi:UDP-N-acetylglucosamine--N-acetylmuramyl-(pentapeptide) pyrophosphoryl-undecaprenol N-acetylglucosamine transferase
MTRPCFVFACGGTSGHVHPALAIAEKVRQDYPGAAIRFFGTARGMESEVVPAAGFAFTAIRARGFPRKLSADWLLALRDFFASRRQCRRLLRDLAPQAVVGTGGYVAGPVIAAALSLGIPVLLHEQNAYPGRSNRLLARRSQAVCVSFPGTGRFFPAGTPVSLTGNPVREVFFKTGRQEARQALAISEERPVVLAMGGSLGARTINEAVLGLVNPSGHPLVILSAGKQHYAAVSAAAAGIDWLDVREYLQDVHLYMAAADLVICRSGAMTCAELAALGKPSILVPYPYATADHQYFNARVLADAAAAHVIRDSELTPDRLQTMLAQLLEDRAALAAMGAAAAGLARPQAAESICTRLYEVMR